MTDWKAIRQHMNTPIYWGKFDISNNKHKYILSLLRQMDWVTINHDTGRALADVERFGKWLQSEKAPVQKPLRKQNPAELSKTITALENMVNKKYK